MVVLIESFSLGNREINILRVRCSNANRGCEWVGTVGTIEKHVTTCGFTLVPCPKQCKDDNNEVKCFTRKEVDEHLKNDCPNRDYECQSKCGEKGTYAYVTEIHDKTCTMKILPCPNDGCLIEIQRQQVSEHISKCPHTVIPCKYKGIGCDTELKREDMAAHEQDDKLHLHMALEAVISQQAAIDSLQASVKALQFDKLLSDSRTFRLSEYRKKKEANESFEFPPFYTHPNGYHIALIVDANGNDDGEGTHVSVGALILKGEYDAKLKWPFLGKVTFTLLNQLEDENHCTKMTIFDTEKFAIAADNIAWGHVNFISHSALSRDPVKNTQYLKNDTLYFRMEVEIEHKP